MLVDTIKKEFEISDEVSAEYHLYEIGGSKYHGLVPAFEGEDIEIGGRYYNRNMTMQDIEKFLVKQDDNDK
ncbi:MAG: hypothetical protein HRU29_04995 [Rhizobiales bacterium]|nr:hypothetical protein [Hyphomicrobiales bacterium]NRB13741.1 hypothetical protein [Hyphomicrobiales bacterium]